MEYLCCKGSKSIGKTKDKWQLCRITIVVTFSESNKFLGFFNSSHIDIKDRYKKSIQKDLVAFTDKCGDNIFKRDVQSNLQVGIGKPTTCAYQFINMSGMDIDGELFQFFCYYGLGIALRINDFACQTFYGHLTTHRTALPLIVRDGLVYYTDEHIGVFAWGKS